eukprot:3943034-Alexandrium_andersonii.AAC.1
MGCLGSAHAFRRFADPQGPVQPAHRGTQGRRVGPPHHGPEGPQLLRVPAGLRVAGAHAWVAPGRPAAAPGQDLQVYSSDLRE